MARRLGEILVAGKKIKPQDLKKALDAQLIFGGRLGTNLLELGLLDERTLAEVLKEQRRVEVATRDLLDSAAPEALRHVPAKFAELHSLIPIQVEGKKLKVAMADPTDLIVQDELSFMTGMSIIPLIAPEVRLSLYLERYYKIPRPTRYIQLSPSKSPSRAVDPAMAGELDDESLQAMYGDQLQEADSEASTDDAPVGGPSGRASANRSNMFQRPLSGEDLAPAHEQVLSINDLLGVEPGETVTPQTLHEAGEEKVDAAVAELKRQREDAERAAESGATDGPLSLEEAAVMLSEAESREEIGHAMVGFARGQFQRVMAWIIQKDQALGWQAALPGMSREKAQREARAMLATLGEPSVLQTVVESGQYYMGELPARPGDEALAEALGEPRPLNVVILPVTFHERVLLALYGDNGDQPLESFDMRGLRSVCQKAAQAMEVLLLRSRIRQT